MHTLLFLKTLAANPLYLVDLLSIFPSAQLSQELSISNYAFDWKLKTLFSSLTHFLSQAAVFYLHPPHIWLQNPSFLSLFTSFLNINPLLQNLSATFLLHCSTAFLFATQTAFFASRPVLLQIFFQKCTCLYCAWCFTFLILFFSTSNDYPILPVLYSEKLQGTL